MYPFRSHRAPAARSVCHARWGTTIFTAAQSQNDPVPGNGAGDDIVAQAEAYRAAGRLDKAEASLRKHRRTHPKDPRSLHVLGLIARDRGRIDRAIQLLDKAVAAAPASPDIRCDLGLALKAAGRHEEAVSAQTRVTELLPDSAFAWSNLGSALAESKRYDDALAAFEKALSLEPYTAEIHYNLGNARLALGDPEAAETAFVRALEFSPRHTGALTNLACALKEQGRLAEAEDFLRGACALFPDNADLRWNHALALLMSGNYREGWAAYEARRDIPGFAVKTQPLPPWNGGGLGGRTVLVHAEQGLGDTIQFCRYLRLLDDLDGDVLFQAPSRLLPLLRSLTTRAEITGDAKAASLCDLEAPLMSLPHIFGPNRPFWPEGGPYLAPEFDRAAHWQDRLAGHRGLSVAIAWQGDPGYRADGTRSIPLAAFAPLAGVPDLRLISLQQGPGRAQIESFEGDAEILDLGGDIDRDGAFLDSAAILANVDLAITSDTALAHLAGAVGTPVWLALSHVPDWRWGPDGDTSGWYPAMRLFRQKAPGDWDSVFRTIAKSITATSMKEKYS